MSKEKRIEECYDLEEIIYMSGYGLHRGDCYAIANQIQEQGYRKQSEGEWIKDEESKFEHRYHCSVCNFYLIGAPTKYCEDCGAKMKGGAEN